jgi:hypothetical protein
VAALRYQRWEVRRGAARGYYPDCSKGPTPKKHPKTWPCLFIGFGIQEWEWEWGLIVLFPFNVDPRPMEAKAIGDVRNKRYLFEEVCRLPVWRVSARRESISPWE